jgi:hypothetical protein
MRKSGISVMLAALWLCASRSSLAQTFTTVFSFDGKDGSGPVGLVRLCRERYRGGHIERCDGTEDGVPRRIASVLVSVGNASGEHHRRWRYEHAAHWDIGANKGS